MAVCFKTCEDVANGVGFAGPEPVTSILRFYRLALGQLTIGQPLTVIDGLAPQFYQRALAAPARSPSPLLQTRLGQPTPDSCRPDPTLRSAKPLTSVSQTRPCHLGRCNLEVQKMPSEQAKPISPSFGVTHIANPHVSLSKPLDLMPVSLCEEGPTTWSVAVISLRSVSMAFV